MNKPAAIVASAITAILLVTACEPISDGADGKRSLRYNEPKNPAGQTATVKKVQHGKVLVRYSNGSQRWYRVGIEKLYLCSPGEAWPSCTKKK